MPRTSLELPLRYRRRALARLDDPIARAERDLERRLAGAGRTVASVARPVRLAEGRLDPPRRSRHSPLTGEPQSAGTGPRPVRRGTATRQVRDRAARRPGQGPGRGGDGSDRQARDDAGPQDRGLGGAAAGADGGRRPAITR